MRGKCLLIILSATGDHIPTGNFLHTRLDLGYLSNCSIGLFRKEYRWVLALPFCLFFPNENSPGHKFPCGCSALLISLHPHDTSFFYKYTFYFRTFFDLQPSCEDSTESFHIPQTKPSLLLTAYVSMVRLAQFSWTNIIMSLLTISRRYPQLLPNALYLSQGPIQDTTLHLLVMSP